MRVWNDDWVFRGEDRAFERKEKSDAAKERGVRLSRGWYDIARG